VLDTLKVLRSRGLVARAARYRDQTSVERALLYLKQHARGANLMDLMRLEYCADLREPPGYEWSEKETLVDDKHRFFLASVMASKRYKALVLSVILTHCALAFWEAPSRSLYSDRELKGSYANNLLIVSAVCISLEALDVCLSEYVTSLRKTVVNPLTHRIERPLDYSQLCLIGLVGVFVLDWVLAVLGYYQRVSEQRKGMVLLLPWSSVLRPLLPIFRFEKVARYMTQLLSTGFQSRSVIIIVLLMVVTAAIVNTVIFAGREPQGLLSGRNFDNFFSSFLQTFLFILTSYNYDALYDYISCGGGGGGEDDDATTQGALSGVPACGNGVFALYFIVLTLLGSLVLVSLLIQEFQIRYEIQIAANADYMRYKAVQASVAAFFALDSDYSGVLEYNELCVFFQVRRCEEETG
jgi:hypothetical protein